MSTMQLTNNASCQATHRIKTKLPERTMEDLLSRVRIAGFRDHRDYALSILESHVYGVITPARSRFPGGQFIRSIDSIMESRGRSDDPNGKCTEDLDLYAADESLKIDLLALKQLMNPVWSLSEYVRYVINVHLYGLMFIAQSVSMPAVNGRDGMGGVGG